MNFPVFLYNSIISLSSPSGITLDKYNLINTLSLSLSENSKYYISWDRVIGGKGGLDVFYPPEWNALMYYYFILLKVV